MLKKLAVLFVIVLVLFVCVGFILPADYAMARSIEIDASPAEIHKYVGDLEKWEEWEPWKEADPTIEVTRGAKTTGVGASQSWTSADGLGQLTFTEWDPSSGVTYDFAIGDMGASVGGFEYATGTDGKTKVTWSMAGEANMPVLGPYFAMLMGSLVGPSFEKGLENLKRSVEAK